MAATLVGIVKDASGKVTMVVVPDNDAQLDGVPLKAGETMVKLSKTVYQTYKNMKALATAQGLIE